MTLIAKCAFILLLPLAANASSLGEYMQFSLKPFGAVEIESIAAAKVGVNIRGLYRYYEAGLTNQISDFSVTRVSFSRRHLSIMPLVRTDEGSSPIVDFYVQISGGSAHDIENAVRNLARAYPLTQFSVEDLASSGQILVHTLNSTADRFLFFHPQILITAKNSVDAHGRDSRFWAYTVESRHGDPVRTLENKNNIESASQIIRHVVLNVIAQVQAKDVPPCVRAVVGSDLALAVAVPK